MPWPISQDYNEAVQTPQSSFADPELKGGEPALNAMGLPMPCSGNFADVYQFQGASGSKWAVKCFTREIPGLRERYVEVSKYLAENQLPFMVEFKFLQQGIRIRGQWYPVLKMNWVEGYTLNQFVRHALDKPKVLHTLCQIWVKMAVKMREAHLAHCDLQHGNVLLVPAQKGASLGVRLVDYDGMCVPSLELLKSIELGHPNFQHPQRLREGTYGLEVDRFSHLVIYTALRALAVGGKALWDKYDNGDNLLFRQRDFETAARSDLFADLLRMEKPIHDLAGTLIDAARTGLEHAPLLGDLVPIQSVTEVKPKAQTTIAPEETAPAPEPEMNPFADAFTDSEITPPRSKRQTARRPLWPWLAAGGGVAAVLLIVLIAVLGGKKDGNEFVNNPFKPPIGKGGGQGDKKNSKKDDTPNEIDKKANGGGKKKNTDHERDVAEWALDHGAQVYVQLDVGNWKNVNRLADLPDQSFSLININFYQAGKLTDDDMKRIRDLPELNALILYSQPITGTGLGHLKNVPRLSQLILNNSQIADDDLIHLKNLPQLTNLDLNATRISDKGLAHLEGCTNLRSLNLDRTAVSNKGLAHLEGLTNLTFLNVDHTAVDDDGLTRLQKLVQLNNLNLGKVSDTGLAHLEGLPKLHSLSLSAPFGPLSNLEKLGQLRFLSLRGTAVDDNVLTHVKALSKLDALSLLETHVSDAGLIHLQESKSLRNVYLLNNRVTQDGANKLKAAVPICRIQLDGKEVLFNNRWDDLRLVGTNIKDDVLQISPGGSLTTKNRYQGPIEVHLQIRSSSKGFQFSVYKFSIVFSLPNSEWHPVRIVINEKDYEAWVGKRRISQGPTPPQTRFFPDSVRINSNDGDLHIKSFEVKDLAPPVQVVQGEGNGLFVKDEIDCMEKPRQFAMGKFRLDKDWRLSLEYQVPEIETDVVRGLFLWGFSRLDKSPVSVEHVGKAIRVIVADAKSKNSTGSDVEIPAAMAGKWIRIQFDYKLSSRLMSLDLGGKARNQWVISQEPKLDVPVPVWIGSDPKNGPLFKGRIRNVRMENIGSPAMETKPVVVANGLDVKEELDCAEKIHPLQIGATFDTSKDWLLFLELMPQKEETDTWFFYLPEGIILTTGKNGLHGNVYDNQRGFSIGSGPLPAEPRWVPVGVRYRASAKETELYLDGKLVQKTSLGKFDFNPRLKLPAQAIIGGVNEKTARFKGKVRSLWLGNEGIEEKLALALKTVREVVKEKPDNLPVVKKKQRLPVPTPKEIADAEKKLRATYAELYGKDDFNSRFRLADTLFNLARNTGDDSVLQYAALSEARDLAAKNNNGRRVFEIIHLMQDAFEIDTLSHLVRVMDLALLFSKNTPVENTFVFGLKCLDEAKKADQFATAKLAALTRSAALRFPKDPNSAIMLSALTNKEKLLKKIEEEYKKIKPLIPKAEEDPKNTKAQKAVGRYYAFIKGDWERGLPHLALCGDGTLVPLVEMDLKDPKDPQAQADLANAWRAYADKAAKESNLTKDNIRQRAKTWALRAVAGLPEDGRVQVDDCLKIPYFGKNLKPGLAAEFFQGLKLIRKRIDPNLDFKEGFSKDDKIPQKGFAARWYGFLWVSEPGMYSIGVQCKGTFSVKVDNKEVFSSTRIDNNIGTQRFLVEGLHPVEIQYQNLVGNANFSLTWSLWNAPAREYQNVLYYQLPKK